MGNIKNSQSWQFIDSGTINPPLKSVPIGNDEIGWYELEFRSIREIPTAVKNLAEHFKVPLNQVRIKSKECREID